MRGDVWIFDCDKYSVFSLRFEGEDSRKNRRGQRYGGRRFEGKTKLLDYSSEKNMKKAVCLMLGILGIFGCLNSGNAYYFGMKSSDNSVGNIVNIETQLGVRLPIVSFIFDPWEHSNVLVKLEQIAEELGTNRIYHLTVSPDMFSAKEVAEDVFDSQYLQFFEKVKELDLKVIFRTMHEMNGGRYPWGSNPKAFKEARIHVRQLSRTAGLNQENILFDFSVNHWDMPTKGTPSQTAILYQCKPEKIFTAKEKAAEQQRIANLTEAERLAEEKKKKSEWTDCPRFEDYYPGDMYVDVVGFTFYNRGKASSNRLWLSPEKILFDPDWRTFERLQKLWKPLIVDEVGTTAVWYSGTYNFEKSRAEYLNTTTLKEAWLGELRSFLVKYPEILGAVYFNVDYTHGLSFNVIGEADWAIVNLEDHKVYQGFYDLYQHSEFDLQRIASYFMNAKILELEGKSLIVSSDIVKEVWIIDGLISQKAETKEKKAELVGKLLLIDFNDWRIEKSLNVLKRVYS